MRKFLERSLYEVSRERIRLSLEEEFRMITNTEVSCLRLLKESGILVRKLSMRLSTRRGCKVSKVCWKRLECIEEPGAVATKRDDDSVKSKEERV